MQGRPSAQPEQCQADFWSHKTVAARLLHTPPPLAARGFTRRRQKTQASKGQSQLPPLFPSSPVWPAKHPKTQQAVDFSFSFLCFQICFSFSSSPFQIGFSLQIGSFLFHSHSSLFQVAARPGGPPAAKLLSGLAGGDGEEICCGEGFSVDGDEEIGEDRSGFCGRKTEDSVGFRDGEEVANGKRLREVAVGFRDGVGGDRRTGWEREDLVRWGTKSLC